MAQGNFDSCFRDMMPTALTDHCITLAEFGIRVGFQVTTLDRYYFWNVDAVEVAVSSELLSWCGYGGSLRQKMKKFEQQLINNEYPYCRTGTDSNPILVIPNEVFTQIVLMDRSPKGAEMRHLMRSLLKTTIYYQRYQMLFNKELKRLRKQQEPEQSEEPENQQHCQTDTVAVVPSTPHSTKRTPKPNAKLRELTNISIKRKYVRKNKPNMTHV